jgi:hypothetical protein
MDNTKKTPFDGLAHTVNSKCAALCEAANLLERISPQRADKMLGLMADQVRELDAAIRKCREDLSKQNPS